MLDRKLLPLLLLVAIFTLGALPLTKGPAGLPKKLNGSKGRSFTNTAGMTFVLIDGGTFMMGSPGEEPGRDDDEMQHEVTIGKSFFMQTTEVTQAQWEDLMDYNPSSFSDCGGNCPVESVSLAEVREFIHRLNSFENTGRYRLPTEAEWEYAARAGSRTAFYTGNCLTAEEANFDGRQPLTGCPVGKFRDKTVAVGTFAPNAWGLYDMHGNVWELVQDRKTDLAEESEKPDKPDGHIMRGGSWLSVARNCRSAYRNIISLEGGGSSDSLGFRLVYEE